MQIQEQRQEIELLDYLKIINKRKNILFITIAIFAFVGAILVMRTPKVYEYSMTIDTESMAIKATVLNDKIKQGYYDAEIVQELKFPPDEKFNFNISLPSNSNIMKISLLQKGDDFDSKKIILKQLYKSILEDNENLLLPEKARIEQENAKKLKELDDLEKQINRISKELVDINAKYNILMEANLNLIKSENNVEKGKTMLSSDMLDRLNDKKATTEKALQILRERKEGISASLQSADNLYINRQKNIDIKVGKVESKKQQIIAACIFFGIVAGLFVVFILEFIEKVKTKS